MFMILTFQKPADALPHVLKGDKVEVKRALKWGADVNQRDTDGNALLHLACDKGDMEMIDLLLEYSADVNAKDDTVGNVILREENVLSSPTLLSSVLKQVNSDLVIHGSQGR